MSRSMKYVACFSMTITLISLRQLNESPTQDTKPAVVRVTLAPTPIPTPVSTPRPTPIDTPVPRTSFRPRSEVVKAHRDAPLPKPLGQDSLDWLADCESGKRIKDKRTGQIIILAGTRKNLPCARYCGYFQYSRASWKQFGGPPGLPNEHSYATQKRMAQKAIDCCGRAGQFPACHVILTKMGF